MAGDQSQPKASSERFIARSKGPPICQANDKRIDSSLQAKAGFEIISV